MKFTKEDAFEKLKGILTNNGKKTLRMSEKSIMTQLENLMPLIANDEMELTDFVEKVTATFNVMNSNAEKDNSDFIKQWKKEHPVPPTEPPIDPLVHTDDVLSSKLAALEARVKASEDEKSLQVKRKAIKEKLKGKKISAEWCDIVLDAMPISLEDEVDDKVEKLTILYNKSHAVFPNKFPEWTPGNAGGGNMDIEQFKDIKDSLKKREEAAKNII